MSITHLELDRLVAELVNHHGRDKLAIASMLSFFCSIGPESRKCETHIHMNTLWRLIEPYLDAHKITAMQLQAASIELSRANATVELIDSLFDD